MTYGLRPLLTQLNNGTRTAGNDCAVETILNVTRTVSRGKVGPQQASHHDEWVRFVRHMAGEQDEGLMFRTETLRVYNHPDYERLFRRAGLRPPRVDYAARVSWDTVRARLRGGWIVHLPVDYGVLKQGDAPMGSLSFNGDHSVCLVNPFNRDNFLHCRMGDSLMDGRTRWVNGRIHTYPKGWRTVRVFDYREAAGVWGIPEAGDQRTYAIFVRGS